MRSYDDFVRDGGRPSNMPFSSYSKVCKAVKAYKSVVTADDVFFLDLRQRTLLQEVDRAVTAFRLKKHKETDAKEEQAGAVDVLYRELEGHEKRIAELSTWLEFPTKLPLLANTQSALKANFSSKAWRIVWSTTPGTNALMSGLTTIEINWTIFKEYQAKLGPVGPLGFLVHEYHHSLTQRGGDGWEKYYDEFVAHWKQYDVQGLRKDIPERVTKLNAWLREAYNVGPHISAEHPELFRPEDAGLKFYYLVEDNVRLASPKLPTSLPGSSRPAPGLPSMLPPPLPTAPPLPTSDPTSQPVAPPMPKGAMPSLPGGRPPMPQSPMPKLR